MGSCVICGRPEYLHVAERPLCHDHAQELVLTIERTVDFMKRQHAARRIEVGRFITVGNYARPVAVRD